MSSLAFDYHQLLPAASQGGVVTIGNFDGVHQGHAALIAQAKAQAHERGSKAVVLTFSPHPRELLVPDKPQPLLTTTAERVRLLRQLGADSVVTLRTTPELLGLSAIEFFEQVIQRQLQAIALVEGENFCFGRKREGTIATLQDFAPQLGCL